MEEFPAVVGDGRLVLVSPELGDEFALLTAEAREVDAREPGGDPLVGSSGGEVSDFGDAQEELARNAADVDAGAAERALLDHEDARPELPCLDRRREPGAAAADDEEVGIEPAGRGVDRRLAGRLVDGRLAGAVAMGGGAGCPDRCADTLELRPG